MQTMPLIHRLSATEPSVVLRPVGQKGEEASPRERRPFRGGRMPQALPEDQVTFSGAAMQSQPQKPSPAVSAQERAALLGAQTVTRFSVYG